MYFLKGFNESANKAVQLSMKSAQEMGHIYVGSEHLLLGICKEGTSGGAALLMGRGITVPLVERAIIAAVGKGAKTNLRPEDFSANGSSILENAVKLAGEDGSATVSPEHMLWAIAACEKCAAVAILNSYAIDGA
ncbi:hypothetical protein LJB77_03400, partial [Ruminococcaceae bacterium OttesenSCG-928-N02]|nr:hypothetical protein [Ruminococcaceae bacterium OttesenSCG-928-N02]